MSWQLALDALAWALMISGSAFALIGAIGVLRFPEFWSRLHAASVSESAGLILLLAGMGLYAGVSLVTFKLLLIGLFIFITGPTSTHAVANAAMVSGLRPAKDAEAEAEDAGGDAGAAS